MELTKEQMEQALDELGDKFQADCYAKGITPEQIDLALYDCREELEKIVRTALQLD